METDSNVPESCRTQTADSANGSHPDLPSNLKRYSWSRVEASWGGGDGVRTLRDDLLQQALREFIPLHVKLQQRDAPPAPRIHPFGTPGTHLAELREKVRRRRPPPPQATHP